MNDVILALIAAIGGCGGLVSFFTIPYARKKAKAEAEKTVADSWREYAEKQEERNAKQERRQEQTERKLIALDAQNAALRQIVFISFKCEALLKLPDLACPVQQAFNKLDNGNNVNKNSEED